MLRVRNQALRFGALLLLGASGGGWVEPAPQGDEVHAIKPTDAGGPGKDQGQDGPAVDTPSPRDRGESTTWNPREVWAFFTQF